MTKIIIAITATLLLVSSCSTTNKQQKGTMIGAAGGAAVGAVIGKGSIWGILLGAAIGGAAGNLIGKKMDEQAKELKQAVPTAQVERVGEGINVTFESGLMFQINSSGSAAEVFVKYPETNIIIEGHTDDTGMDDYNMFLSEKRAMAVKTFLHSKGVAEERMSVKWYGESQPKYPNDSEANRQKNRRVELGVIANDKMKKQAKEEKL